MGYLIKILPLDLAELSDRKSPPPFVQGQHHSQPVRQHNHQTHDPECEKGLHTNYLIIILWGFKGLNS